MCKKKEIEACWDYQQGGIEPDYFNIYPEELTNYVSEQEAYENSWLDWYERKVA